MVRKITFSMPEWLYDRTIAQFPSKNNSELISELLMLGAERKMETLKNKEPEQRLTKPAKLSLVCASRVNGSQRLLFSDGVEDVLVEAAQ